MLSFKGKLYLTNFFTETVSVSKAYCWLVDYIFLLFFVCRWFWTLGTRRSVHSSWKNIYGTERSVRTGCWSKRYDNKRGSKGTTYAQLDQCGGVLSYCWNTLLGQQISHRLISVVECYGITVYISMQLSLDLLLDELLLFFLILNHFSVKMKSQ